MSRAVYSGLAVLLLQASCTGGDPRGSEEALDVLESRTGYASFYGPGFQGSTTASGLEFDPENMLAAHPSYPFGTVVRVTNLANGNTANVVIEDRGPYGENRRQGVIIDLSEAAAKQLDFVDEGIAEVRLDVLKWGDETG